MMTETLGHWTAGRIRRLPQHHNGTSGHITQRQADPAPQARATARRTARSPPPLDSFPPDGAVIRYVARPPSSVVTHGASSVVAPGLGRRGIPASPAVLYPCGFPFPSFRGPAPTRAISNPNGPGWHENICPCPDDRGPGSAVAVSGERLRRSRARHLLVQRCGPGLQICAGGSRAQAG